LQRAGHGIVAMHQGDGLAILGKESAIGNVYHLQLIRVVVELHWHEYTF